MAVLSLTVTEAIAKLAQQQAILVDIRHEAHFKQCHHPNAIHLDASSMPHFLQHYPHDCPIMVLCYHGISSYKVAYYLQTVGYETLYSIEGGMETWQQRYPEQLVRKHD